MCTVSFVNSNGRFIITSNRDEKSERPSAIPPKRYVCGGSGLYYPKDGKAGGTWFVMDDNSRIIVLLNGAGECHIPHPPYRKSRGLIPLELMAERTLTEAWDTINLEGIEPFTVIIFDDNRLFMAEWNGIRKKIQELNTEENHIWSSVTLYSAPVREERAGWFSDFMYERIQVMPEDMLHFHRFGKPNDFYNGLVINRGEAVKTVSITQVVVHKNRSEFTYTDLLSENVSKEAFMVF